METLQAQVGKLTDLEQLIPQPGVRAALLIIAGIFAIVYCFYGYRVLRGICAVLGFITGAAAGYTVSQNLGLQSPVDLAVILAAGVVLALLMYFLYRFGVFVTVMLVGAALVFSELTGRGVVNDEVICLIIALIAGIVLAVLSVIFLRPVIIIITSLTGGLLLSDILFKYLIQVRWSEQMALIIPLAAGIVIGLIGMLCQFRSSGIKK